MFQIFRSSTQKHRQKVQTFAEQPEPERPLYVIGDVHGCDGLLEALLSKIETDAAGAAHDLVTLGDYIDRGEGSAAVLVRLKNLSNLSDVTCLMGNHERMLLDFIDDPAKKGPRWIKNGGLQTLASFGVGGLSETAGAAALMAGRDQLLKALGALEPWLRARPLTFQSGNIVVTHAGADPRLPISEQPEKNFLWGHPAFFRDMREDGIWIVHGHTIIDDARAKAGRVSIDTGAFATGILTAAVCKKGSFAFL